MNKKFPFLRQIYSRAIRPSPHAVFLDRDGTVVDHIDYWYRPEEFTIIPKAIEGIQRLNKKNIPVIIITNQPVVAKGKLDIDGLRNHNDVIRKEFAQKGAIIDAIYSCPHHPDADIPTYKKVCLCRKPNTHMLSQAVADFYLTEAKLWMVGDSARDINTGIRFGIETILVQTGQAGGDGRYDVKPMHIVNNLLQAAQHIILTMC